MEITYKREMKHNYLIIGPEEVFNDSYETRMMIANCIDGLLKFHVKQSDNRRSYYYEITSRQPLTRLLEHHSIGAGELCSLITGIAQTLSRMEGYLLCEEQILLEPEYIYIEPECFDVDLCLVPGKQGDFPQDMTGLLQYLLGKVDHQDKTCVVMAYGLYQESLKENYGMADLLKLLSHENGVEGKDREKREKEKKKDGRQEAESEDGMDDWTLLNRIEEKKVQESKIGDNRLKHKNMGGYLIVQLVVMMGVLVIAWALWGTVGMWERWYWLVIAEAVILVTAMLGLYQKQMTGTQHSADRKPSADREESTKWQMVFEEDQKDESLKAADLENDCRTVLLTKSQFADGERYLHGLEPGTDDITIAYVPFMIGKQEGLVDYVLAKETVSRIHVRIDRQGEEYHITDLNSTNGTSVAGRILETNETAALWPGDEIYIANVGFVFT